MYRNGAPLAGGAVVACARTVGRSERVLPAGIYSHAARCNQAGRAKSCLDIARAKE